MQSDLVRPEPSVQAPPLPSLLRYEELISLLASGTGARLACSLSRYLDSVVRRDRTFVQRLGEIRGGVLAPLLTNPVTAALMIPIEAPVA